jgi:NAD(P)-dependent dehydrogenase (short-subunit alcohol dehydrogenase family)
MTTGNGSLTLPKVLSLEGRRVLVAGAAMGIGRATAVCLAELGADLVLADREPLDAVRADVEATGRTAVVLRGDLTDEDFLQRIIAAGPFFSAALIAGVFKGPEGASALEAFDFVMHVNVRAPLTLASGAGPRRMSWSTEWLPAWSAHRCWTACGRPARVPNPRYVPRIRRSWDGP